MTEKQRETWDELAEQCRLPWCSKINVSSKIRRAAIIAMDEDNTFLRKAIQRIQTGEAT